MPLRHFLVIMIVLLSLALLAGFLSLHSSSHPSGWFAAISANDLKEPSAAGAMAKIREDWAQDLRTKRLDEITMLYAPDAVFLAPGSERISGRPAIRDLCKHAMETYTSDMSLHSIATETSGNLAYDSGDYRETVMTTADGVSKDLRGNYLMVFKRQADGQWLILEQVWTEISPSSH
jgi:uncharacterized protein (TIGR02246 family)